MLRVNFAGVSLRDNHYFGGGRLIECAWILRLRAGRRDLGSASILHLCVGWRIWGTPGSCAFAQDDGFGLCLDTAPLRGMAGLGYAWILRLRAGRRICALPRYCTFVLDGGFGVRLDPAPLRGMADLGYSWILRLRAGRRIWAMPRSCTFAWDGVFELHLATAQLYSHPPHNQQIDSERLATYYQSTHYKQWKNACEYQPANDKWLIFLNDAVLVQRAEPRQLPSQTDLDSLKSHFIRHHALGDFNGIAVHCAEIAASLPEISDQFEWIPLRSLLDHLGDDWYNAATKAFSIINWTAIINFAGAAAAALNAPGRYLNASAPPVIYRFILAFRPPYCPDRTR